MPEYIDIPSDHEITLIRKKQETVYKADNHYVVDMTREQSIEQTFNFLARKITTIHRDVITQPVKDGYAETGRAGAAAVSIAVTTEYFDDLKCQDEIAAVYEKLKSSKPNAPAFSIRKPLERK